MLSEFAVLDQIGSGAFSEVFKVRSHADSKLYAVKRAKRAFRSKRDRSLLMREVQMFQRLINPSIEETTQPQRPRERLRRRCDSVEEVSPDFTGYSAPHVVQYLRAWQEDGFFYTQAELCEGGSLAQLLLSFCAGYMPIPVELVWSFVGDIASGLDFIHSKQIVHLDIKPANVFIGNTGSLKIGDFGEAVPTGCDDDGLEGDNTYMAKELLAGSPAMPANDIFSFGLLVFEMVSGTKLPDGGEKWQALRNGQIPQLPTLPSLNEHLKQRQHAQADEHAMQHGEQGGAVGWAGQEGEGERQHREWREREQQKLLQQLVLAMCRPVPAERPLAGQIYMHQAVQALRNDQAPGTTSPRTNRRNLGSQGGGSVFEAGFADDVQMDGAKQQWQLHLKQQQQQQQQLIQTYRNTQSRGLLSIGEARTFVLLKCEEQRQQQQKRQHYQKHLRSSWETGEGGVGRTSSFDQMQRDGEMETASSYDADAAPPSRPERPVRPTLFLVPPEYSGDEGGSMDMCTPRNFNDGDVTPRDPVQCLNWM
jgi:serine/threonine protein kinase